MTGVSQRLHGDGSSLVRDRKTSVRDALSSARHRAGKSEGNWPRHPHQVAPFLPEGTPTPEGAQDRTVDSFESPPNSGRLRVALKSALSRASWNGFLKLSFVSCPVALYPATTAAERVSFRQVNRRTGHRLKHQLVDSITGETVETRDKARGYEVGENRFLLVEDRELDQARSERPPPGTVQLAEPPRPAPGLAVRAAEPEENDEAEEEQGRERMPKRRSRKSMRLPSSRALRTPAPSRSSTSFRRGRLTFGI